MTQSQALSILKTGVNVFLTGEPGSGKTHLINQYVAYLRARGLEPAITASTGIAATHINGMTIHSWSGIGIKTKLDKRDLNKIVLNKYIEKRVRRAKVLIIDEVSMLSPETFSMVDAVCREIKKNSEPFGDMQVILVGDFFQLPPVVKKAKDNGGQTEFFKQPPAVFAYDSSAWTRLNPTICYLTEQYRQDDNNFLAILSSIRRGVFDNNHLRYIETRKIEYRFAPADAPKLFSHNVDVDRVNNEMLAKLPGKPQIFAMSSQGSSVFVAALKKGCLSPETLSLKIGAAVMFTKNNPKERFVNGTLGTVIGNETISDGTGYPVVKMRNNRRIVVKPMDWMIEEDGRTRAKITQLPLRLAWAITVHKSQGMSLEAAVIDLSVVFEFGQGYVALSRVRRLSGLHLLGWNKLAFQVHPEVLIKDELFRAASSKAEIAFSKISPAELAKMHKNFITAAYPVE
ncbi:MAG: AAA family ATPase [Patescibacteria group bacterium]